MLWLLEIELHFPRWTVLLLSLCASIAESEVHEQLTESQYDVRGDNHSSLLTLLNAATPVVFEGKKYHAFTSWDVRWNLRWFADPDGRCRITSTTVELTGHMQLPNLVGGSTKQRQAFYPYLSALRAHEFGHYEIGKDAARAIEHGIQRLPIATNCGTLEQDANAVGRRLRADYQARERQYDQSTGYGKTQGASLTR